MPLIAPLIFLKICPCALSAEPWPNVPDEAPKTVTRYLISWNCEHPPPQYLISWARSKRFCRSDNVSSVSRDIQSMSVCSDVRFVICFGAMDGVGLRIWNTNCWQVLDNIDVHVFGLMFTLRSLLYIVTAQLICHLMQFSIYSIVVTSCRKHHIIY